MSNAQKNTGLFENEVKEFLKESFAFNKLEIVEVVQELWSGYGSLERWEIDGKSIIVKFIRNQITKKHPRGWGGDVGHERKVMSYEIERNFYRQYSSKHSYLAIPQLLNDVQKKEYSITLLEDLKNHQAKPVAHPTEKQIQQALKWLATFHAEFLNSRAEGLWKQGSYWHLTTRSEEFEKMQDKPLQEKAGDIDHRLQSSQFQTVIHGDAKLANFLFNEEKAFAVDFQYVGKGAGIIDVMYFFSSCLSDEELIKDAKRFLDDYFGYLKIQIGNKSLFSKIEKEWRALYPIAWADFLRFLDGWSPGHWKLGEYANEQKQIALDLI